MGFPALGVGGRRERPAGWGRATAAAALVTRRGRRGGGSRRTGINTAASEGWGVSKHKERAVQRRNCGTERRCHPWGRDSGIGSPGQRVYGFPLPSAVLSFLTPAVGLVYSPFPGSPRSLPSLCCVPIWVVFPREEQLVYKHACARGRGMASRFYLTTPACSCAWGFSCSYVSWGHPSLHGPPLLAVAEPSTGPH